VPPSEAVVEKREIEISRNNGDIIEMVPRGVLPSPANRSAVVDLLSALILQHSASRMSFFPSFESPEDRPPQADRLAPMLRGLAEEGIYFGTSSWKYEGWLGTIYSPDRYRTRGRFSKKKFEAECLAEYARTFPVVCGDFAFYQFPSAEYWATLFGKTPGSFLVALKVPEEITVAVWPGHARYGARAGETNGAFLDAGLFRSLFARPLEPYKGRVATLIFEFGTFAKSTFPKPEDFFSRLDQFLAVLPRGFSYAVEVRNPEYLRPDYFALLANHGVAHVLTAWTRMPELGAQMELPGVYTADFTVIRALLTRGRTFAQGVESFEPYQLVREPNEPAREAMRLIADRSRREGRRAYLFVNNRLEGNAPTTIEAVLERLRS
jgi:uncharacterized protein YecE (DUF72 family)